MGCELEPGVPAAGPQTALEGELTKAHSTIEALRDEIERTPESTVDSGEKSKQVTDKTDDDDPVKEPWWLKE